MTNNGMPSLEIIFKGLGTTAVVRGERGSAVLIVADDTTADYFVKYETISDFGSEEQAKFTPGNVKYIKDALEGAPLELYVATMPETAYVLTDVLKKLEGLIPRNSWVAVATGVQQDQDDMVTWIKAQRANQKKRYKAVVYKATSSDDMGVVNFTNAKIVEAVDTATELTGDKAVPYLMGFLAGIPLGMSAIAYNITKYHTVEEPADLDAAIANGEFVLFNDEGIVKAARGVNSLITLGQYITNEMTHINTVEKMDMIYCDIYKAWDEGYKGRYPNTLDYQMLLISAINAYFSLLAIDSILDPNFDNHAEVDIEKQKLANYPKYGQSTVDGWSDTKAMQMTYSTLVYLKANVKIAGIMEDFFIDIFM